MTDEERNNLNKTCNEINLIYQMNQDARTETKRNTWQMVNFTIIFMLAIFTFMTQTTSCLRYVLYRCLITVALMGAIYLWHYTCKLQELQIYIETKVKDSLSDIAKGLIDKGKNMNLFSGFEKFIDNNFDYFFYSTFIIILLVIILIATLYIFMPCICCKF